MRTPSVAHLVRAVARNLAAVSQALESDTEGEVALRVLTLTGPAGAVLLDPALNPIYDAVLASLSRQGWSGGDLFVTTVDAERQELVLPDPAAALGIPAGSLASLGPAGIAEPHPDGTRVPIGGMLCPDGTDTSTTVVSGRLLARVGMDWEPASAAQVDAVTTLASRLPIVTDADGAREAVRGLTGGLWER